ncbi:MAG: hypothetical protein HQ546_02740, partial [Planctomycetes bacterium]|nr:hypothetical protein [Planctomycetota bacterium]
MMRQTLIVLLFAAVGLADVGRLEVVETDSVKKQPGGGYKVFPGAKGPANMAPAPKPAPKAPAAKQPGKDKLAAERAKLLKKDIDSFRLHLTHVDENRKTTHTVTLSVRKPAPAKPGGNKVAVQVTKEQAAAIIDYLEKKGGLGYMIDSVLLKILSMMIPAPHLHVHVAAGKYSFEAFLGNWTWANGLVDGMRKVLPGDGPAAKELDKFTKALGAQRKKWAKNPFGRAAAQMGAALRKLLKQQVARFVLEVRYYGPQDKTKPFFSLTLSAAGLAGGLKRAPWAPAVQISKAQALKIIDHLHAAGALNNAGNLRTKGFWPAPPKGPTYSLIVKGLPQLPLHESLGWDLKMLKRLDALRKVLDGDAAKAMDKLLAPLAGHRRKWEAAAKAPPARRPAKGAPPLRTSPSPFRLRASGVKYVGAVLPRPPAGPDGRKIVLAGVAYYRSIMAGGFVAEDLAAKKARVYPMFGLAIAAGWYKMKDSGYLPSDIRGLYRQGKLLWMGSNGVGVIVYDTKAKTWARHDVKGVPVRGHHVTVFHADSEFAFAAHGWHPEVPIAEPSLHVFSVKHKRWLRITGIPSKDALRLGHSEGLIVSRGWDYRPYGRQEYVPLGGTKTPGLASPRQLVRRPDGSYLLRYGHPQRESSLTELVVRPANLRAAFVAKPMK